MVSRVIQFRIDEKLFEKIKQLAEKEGFKSPNLYIKNMLLKQLVEEGKATDMANITRRINRLEKMIERTNRELGRIGKEVALLWKAVRELSEGRQ
ncbi:MAG: hypothetical protein ABGF52_08605 [Candidatus Asgardarchaeum sp.]